MKKQRQIVFDTETTGLNKFGLPYIGHRIIEIGAIELINRKFTGKIFHTYLNPNRLIDTEAFKIHGINNEFLKNKKNFKEISNDFLKLIKDADLIAHNAMFDVNFINYEFSLINKNFPKIENLCNIIDTLSIARKLFPRKKNSLNSLCKRFEINKSKRVLHSALVDAKLLTKVYLFMTGGQQILKPKKETKFNEEKYKNKKILNLTNTIYANKKEILNHNLFFKTNQNI
ncbi:DNA polymerase III subunit epsilon [Enterobacteriaceae bacterium ET-AT1-13]|nr:DNA polymerase III subunit epsilon [Enterobacteriaceae bacterium ET-AT1-13]WGS66459.1 DNA polymerase III subunit epsilon [Enterobacteriaceae bacterium Cmel17]WMC17484.1 MAG: DNA polymerase III subunit epsilon [Enterobacteriaceae bacterium Cmel21]WMC17690.1 MAG: DNA polymerase III subunit epsilon [Enterobacteriaceae bacterium PSmelAO3-2]WMC17894.1 MAG: DNA polymerase III subunit epsilon [Enterobacteriaceae bacterium PSmelAO3-1]WMC18097.1 MAG: DNA polymerase III subunit epsilon [Enterobacteri